MGDSRPPDFRCVTRYWGKERAGLATRGSCDDELSTQMVTPMMEAPREEKRDINTEMTKTLGGESHEQLVQ